MKIVWLKYSFFLIFLVIFLLSMACDRNRGEDNEEFKKITYQPSDKPIDSMNAVDYSQTATIKRKGIKQPRKLALIVAISKYPPENGWLPTHANNDIHLVKSALALQGFDTLHHVKVLQDKSATKNGIIAAIENDLINGANPGDKIVFHFSGHGQQVFDTSGDELDQFDESLVPYDAPLFASGDYQGESHLIDDELNDLFYQLRKKLGSNGSLLVTLDACYSGTATRSANSGYFRGTHHKMMSGRKSNSNYLGDGIDDSWNLTTNEGDTTLSPIIVLSASQSDQINHEIELAPETFAGSLSYALNQSLQNLPVNSSYRALYNQVVYHITSKVPNQLPYAEGMLDYQIFTAIPRASPIYFDLLYQPNDSTLIVSASLFTGIKKGDQLYVYPAHISDTSATKKVNRGIVDYADFWHSKIILQKPFKPERLTDYWVIPQRNLENTSRIRINGNDKLSQWLKTSRQFGFNRVEQAPEIQIAINEVGKNDIQLIIKDDHHRQVFEGSYPSEVLQREFLLNTISTAIKKIKQANRLRHLNIQDPGLQVKFEVLPVMVKKDQAGNPVFSGYKRLNSGNKMLQFHDQDYFKLKVTNNNDFPVYFSILDVYSNHEITQLYPVKAKNVNAFLISGNQEMEIPYLYYATEPYGKDYLKLVVSDQPFIKMNSFTFDAPGLQENLLPVKMAKENEQLKLTQKLTIKTITYETLKPGT